VGVDVMVGVKVNDAVTVGVAEGVRVRRGGRGVEVTVAVAVGFVKEKFEHPDTSRMSIINNKDRNI